MFPNSKCCCQKQTLFAPKLFELEGRRYKVKRKKIKGTGKAWIEFLKQTIIVATPFFAMLFGAKSKNPAVCQAIINNLKSISGGKILPLTDMHGNGLTLKVR